MGRSGIRRRKAARHLPKVHGHVDAGAFGTTHSAYTIEGRIEAAGQLGHGMRSASDRQWRSVTRMAAFTIAAAVLVVVILAVLGLH